MNTTGYKIKKSIIYLALILLAAVCLLPFILMTVNATRTGRDIMTYFTFIPGNALKENWEIVTGYFNLFLGFWNSLKVAIPSTILCIYFSAITAYALAIYEFKGNKTVSLVIIIFMMIPGQLGLIGFYNLVTGLHMVNSYLPLILPSIASTGTVFFLRQYTLSILSKTLLEAARIDGAKELHIFHRIVLPILSPGLATMAIGAFIGSWNNYLTPLIILNTPEKFTLPVMIASLQSSQDIASQQGAIYLSVAISTIPIIIVFCFCSKYIIGSVTAGAVKE